MKQLFSFFIISILLVAFSVQKNTPVELTQLVVTIPELNSSKLQKNLELEFKNLGGVKTCETSLMTKTLMMNYDHRKVGKNEIKNVFQKWECNPGSYSYQKLY
jgi:copper chaperone CopZ